MCQSGESFPTMNPAASNLIRAPFCEKACPPRSCSNVDAAQKRKKCFHVDKGDDDAKRDRVGKRLRWLRLGNCVIGGGRHGHCPSTLSSGHQCYPALLLCCSAALLPATESQGASTGFAKAGSVLREGGQGPVQESR